jgi:hypothetical protein
VRPKDQPSPGTSATAPSLRKESQLKLANEFGVAQPEGGEDEYEELDQRAIDAAHWVDKEIRKLIAEIQR